MALKKLVDVGVAFPVKRPRLGPAPPPADVLDNVGAPEASAPKLVAPPSDVPLARPLADPSGASSAVVHAGSLARDGRGVHVGLGIDARRGEKSGRSYQFGARTTVAFSDEVKRLAAKRKVTIGEVLEDMLKAYRRSAGT